MKNYIRGKYFCSGYLKKFIKVELKHEVILVPKYRVFKKLMESAYHEKNKKTNTQIPKSFSTKVKL